MKYKVMIHIDNGGIEYMDNDVAVLVMMPYVPRIGETVHTDHKTQAKMETQARQSLDIAQRYTPDFFYCGYPIYGKSLTREHLPKLNFSDAIRVSSVLYRTGEDIIHIELSQ